MRISDVIEMENCVKIRKLVSECHCFDNATETRSRMILEMMMIFDKTDPMKTHWFGSVSAVTYHDGQLASNLHVNKALLSLVVV